MPLPAVPRLVILAVSAGAALAQTPVRVQDGPRREDRFTPDHPAMKAKQRPSQDANGNPLRYALTGHVSNYDEAKVGAYTLPDPLVLLSGEPVTNAETWFKERRPEIVRLYEMEIYGRVPATAPKVTFDVVATQENALEGTAVRKHIVGRFGAGADAPTLNIVLLLPAHASGPVPVLLHLVFSGGLLAPRTTAPSGATPGNAERFMETGPIAEILAQGYGYATLRYTEIEGDRAETSLTGVRRLALAPGQHEPAADEWGTIAAWSWGASRVLDHFETDPAIDARRVALIGHSRLGKTVLWAGARDPRFALIFSSCSGEMGAALARRDFGESVDDMALNYPWQFAGNFQKYIGRWNQMPVDAHMLIALAAPRPVFVTGGTRDQWADPHGEFLAQIAAGPVYRLLGKKDLGTDQLPPLDTPLIAADLGFLYHAGGHAIMAGDWNAFFEFARRYLRNE
jgi:hypothetical protein